MERNRQLSDLFEYKSCSFTTVNEKLKTKDNFEHVAIYNNLDQLIDRMIQERNIDENNVLILINCLSNVLSLWSTSMSSVSVCKIKHFKSSSISSIVSVMFSGCGALLCFLFQSVKSSTLNLLLYHQLFQ